MAQKRESNVVGNVTAGFISQRDLAITSWRGVFIYLIFLISGFAWRDVGEIPEKKEPSQF